MSSIEIIRGATAGYQGHLTVPHAKQQMARAKLGELRRSGHITDVTMEQARRRGEITFRYVQLRPLPRQMPVWLRLLAGGAMALGGMAALSALLWESRYVIMAVVLTAVGVAAVAVLTPANGHSSGCAGLHCSGCQG